MIKLVSYRGSFVHPECLEPLHKMNEKGKSLGWKSFRIEACRFGAHEFNPISALQTGREFHIQVGGSIESLWSVAIPLGFIPWNRYPIEDESSHIFHYYGKWAPIIDFLHSEGRGELAWSSFCCAALVEIGAWKGDKPQEREIQAHLHRLGIHCGPVDGIIGQRTLSALKNLGLAELRHENILENIRNWELKEEEKQEPKLGHIYLGGHKASVFTSGEVQAIQSNNGYTISIEGSGKIIIFVDN